MKTLWASLCILVTLVAIVGCGGLRDEEVILTEEEVKEAKIEVPEPRYYKWVEETVEEKVPCIKYRKVKKEIPVKTFKVEEEVVPCRTWKKVETWVPCKVWETYYEDSDEDYCTTRVPVKDQYLTWEQSCDTKLVGSIGKKVEKKEFYDIAEIRSTLECTQCVQTDPCADCHEKITMRLDKITPVAVKRIRPELVDDLKVHEVMDCDVKPVQKEREVMRQAWCKPEKVKKQRIVDGRRLVTQNVMIEVNRTVRKRIPVTETRTIEVEEPYEVMETVKRTVKRRVPSPKCEDVPCPPKPKKVEFCDPCVGDVVCDPCDDGGICKVKSTGLPYIQKGKKVDALNVLIPAGAEKVKEAKAAPAEAEEKKDAIPGKAPKIDDEAEKTMSAKK